MVKGVQPIILNLDDTKKERIAEGVDFEITEHTSIKKELKNRGQSTIYSKKYGTSWEDKDAFQEQYSCECGHYTGKFRNGTICPECHKEVKFNGSDVNVTGWLTMENSKIFHPNLYAFIQNIIGESELNEIIKSPLVDVNGHIVHNRDGFHRMGMTQFTKRWKEVLDFYIKKKPNKRSSYDLIMKHKDKVLTQSIPVFSLIMRPIHSSSLTFSNKANTYYNVLSRNVKDLNSKKYITEMEREDKLEEIQLYFNMIYNYCLNSIASKEGHIRSNIMGARFNNSTRTVIVPLSEGCDIDEIEIPYLSFLEVYKLEIVGIIKTLRNVTHNEALKIWREATFEFSQEVYNIMMMMIKKSENGVPYIINRNPSIRYGSILKMYIRKIDPEIDNYVMRIPLQVLTFLNADFDGDALNGLSIKSKDILKALDINNPKYNMVISRNNGLLSKDSFLIKDQVTIISDLCNLPYRLEEERKKRG